MSKQEGDSTLKLAAMVLTLALLSPMAARAGLEAVDGDRTTPLFPLFITCDLKSEFVTPDVDPRTVAWFDTPVSRENEMKCGTESPVIALKKGRGACVWVAIQLIDVNLAKTTHVLLPGLN